MPLSAAGRNVRFILRASLVFSAGETREPPTAWSRLEFVFQECLVVLVRRLGSWSYYVSSA